MNTSNQLLKDTIKRLLKDNHTSVEEALLIVVEHFDPLEVSQALRELKLIK